MAAVTASNNVNSQSYVHSSDADTLATVIPDICMEEEGKSRNLSSGEVMRKNKRNCTVFW